MKLSLSQVLHTYNEYNENPMNLKELEKELSNVAETLLLRMPDIWEEHSN